MECSNISVQITIYFRTVGTICRTSVIICADKKKLYVYKHRFLWCNYSV